MTVSLGVPVIDVTKGISMLMCRGNVRIVSLYTQNFKFQMFSDLRWPVMD